MRDIPGEVRLMTEERNIDQREGVRRRNVCRRLFQDDEGNGENDNLVNRLFEEARRNQENAKERWNFDFEREVPLSGRYEWVRIDRDGNEISDFAQSKNEVHNSQEERPKEAAEADTEEKE